jgi:hypothetical protein
MFVLVGFVYFGNCIEAVRESTCQIIYNVPDLDLIEVNKPINAWQLGIWVTDYAVILGRVHVHHRLPQFDLSLSVLCKHILLIELNKVPNQLSYPLVLDIMKPSDPYVCLLPIPLKVVSD